VSRKDRPIDRIAPDGFVEQYDADTVEEALRKAEEAPTSSDPDTFSRCPGRTKTGDACLSTRIHTKKPGGECEHRRDEPKKCTNCWLHFSVPVAPVAAFDANAPRCPECGGPRLVDADDVASSWECLGCGERFDEAVEALEEAVEAPDEAVEALEEAVEAPDEADEADEADQAVAPTADGDHDRGDDTPPIMPRQLQTPTDEYGIPTGDDLRELREALDLALADVPVAAGTTIGRWERGETAPRLDRVEELVEYYRLVDGARRAARLDAAVGATDAEPEPEEETVEDADPGSPEAEPDPFDWVDETDLRVATDGGETEP
jgi:transcriptional regulator with XRE-family HTH domain/transcription elongation factor Elf1